ncbi:MAG: Hsp20/alpha crystallin family protein [Bacteroidota bacterium]|jgi:HSP20 family protein
MSLLKRRKEGIFPSTITDLFEDRFFRPFYPGMMDLWEGGASIPPANLVENNNEYRLEISAPGFSKDDFNVEMQDGSLLVSAEHEDESKDERENYRRREFSWNSFTRTFSLPDNAREEQINAKYENGMLKITIPKKEITTSKPKKEIMVA